MKTTIKDIRVWYDRNITDKSKREYRIYVHTTDGREGCYYLTGNRWHTAKTTDGKLTDAEWSEARELGYYDGKWHTLYENQIHITEQANDAHSTSARRCPDCGEFDCGANCNSNHVEANQVRGDGQPHARWETEENLSRLGL